MSKEMAAVLVFGGIAVFSVIMFVLERRAVARRKAARGGREIDIASILAGTGDTAQGASAQK
ncbi:MAG: hypothetical protein HRU30_19875 [Rhodobacteraceae bacterium]|nr:hypothetical protein [Paracoccaceae bacterium]